MKYYLLK